MWQSLFSSLVELRRSLYAKGFFKVKKLKIPIIAIGNITMGGAGKTPFVIFLVQELLKRGYRVGVVVKSYKADAKSPHRVQVGPGSALYSGDEAVLIQLCCGGAVVWSGPVKNETAEALALEHADLDWIVVDDGLQHLALEANRRVLLLDMSVKQSEYSFPPFGRLRESVQRIPFYDVVIQTQMHQASEANLECLKPYLQEFTNKGLGAKGASRLFKSYFKITSLVGAWDALEVFPEFKKCFLFCGLAKPERFLNSTEEFFKKNLGRGAPEIVGSKFYPDHYAYQMSDYQELLQLAAPADVLITTQKDLVKIQHWPLVTGKPILVLRGEFSLENADDVEGLIQSIIGERS